MIISKREVLDPVLIGEMLKLMDTVYVAMNDDDGTPYIVPLNFGFEITDTQLIVYIHSPRPGKKNELITKDPRVCLAFSVYNDFPDKKYRGTRHDFRSVIAKGTAKLVRRSEDPETWVRAYEHMYTDNHREIKPLSDWKVIPDIYMGVIACDLSDVTGKSEFPLRKPEDVPFINVYEMPDDDTPLDYSGLIEKNNRIREERSRKKTEQE